MNDTSPEIAELVRTRLLARSGSDRVAMGSRMFETARAIVLASFPSGLSPLEIKSRLCERLYGNEVELEAFIEHLRIEALPARADRGIEITEDEPTDRELQR